MVRLFTGQLMPNFSFRTPFKNDLSFYDEVEGKKTAILFHRFIGCRLSQFDIRNLIQAYDQIAASGTNVFVVVQSPPETVRGYYAESSLPIIIICDPEQLLYKQFEIPVAASVEELKGGNFNKKMEEIEKKILSKAILKGNHYNYLR